MRPVLVSIVLVLAAAACPNPRKQVDEGKKQVASQWTRKYVEEAFPPVGDDPFRQTMSDDIKTARRSP